VGYQKPDSEKDYALILGASSGFGEAVALELAAEGFNILGVHMDRGAGITKVEQIKRQITDHGVEAMYFNLNAASDKNREQVIQRIQDHFKIKNTQYGDATIATLFIQNKILILKIFTKTIQYLI